MLRFIITILAFAVVAVTFYYYGFGRGYSNALEDSFNALLNKAKAQGLITAEIEVLEFASQYFKMFQESEDE